MCVYVYVYIFSYLGGNYVSRRYNINIKLNYLLHCMIDI